MKNILVLVHDDPGQEARLQAALDLTRAVEGHLICVDVAAPPVAMADAYIGYVDTTMLDERPLEAANRDRLTARLRQEDVAWSWIDCVGDMADRLIAHASLADVIVVNRRLRRFGYPDMVGLASRIVMEVGAMVVAVDEAERRFPAAGRALIAWDGRIASTAALRASVPLLALADAVEIFTVTGSGLHPDTEAAAQYLSRHGVHADVRTVERNGEPVDALIRAEAASFGADYLVTGAYSHGRLAEMFGGVTKRLLTDSPLPLVLCRAS